MNFFTNFFIQYQNVHAKQLKEFDEKAEEIKSNYRYRYSTEVAEMKRAEVALNKAHLYKEAKEVYRRCRLKMKQEEEAMNRELNKKLQLKRERLLVRQEDEMRNLKGHIRNVKKRAKMQRDLDFERFYFFSIVIMFQNL